jgi:tRNA modification GTPase
MSDTIAAIATAPAVSAIGIIRISGDQAISVAGKVFKPKNNMALQDGAGRKLYLGDLCDSAGNVIDICLCTVSRGPHSYTGEDTAEIQCHGSPVVLQEGLLSLFNAGARQAGPGEFTKRAFLNGRLDLSMAEAVIDLIEADTAAAAKNAAGQLGGAVARRFAKIYDGLLDVMAHFHAVLDYPDEDIDDFSLRNYTDLLDRAEKELDALLDSYKRGIIIKSGVPCAIIGRPNTGKSSLLNALLGYERAIVTSRAGTTRDTIEEKVELGGVPLRLIDTAGIRDTDDEVEKIGVGRSMTAVQNAELIIAVFDGSEALTPEDYTVIETARSAAHCIPVVNKCDLNHKIDLGIIEGLGGFCLISAKERIGLSELEEAVTAIFSGGNLPPNGEILTNARHFDVASRAKSHINDAKKSMLGGLTPDAVLTDIEAALSVLGEISGAAMREDITSRIFERFCVGK